MIKVIGGEARGRKLKSLPGKKTRPLLARVKKSLFDILGKRIENSIFLDLYAGTGSVGIETLSRGAKEVIFVEEDYQAVEIIKENLTRLSLYDKGTVIRANVLKLDFPEEKKFDFIFIGPPYKDKLILSSLELIAKKKILAHGGWIIAQHHLREVLPLEYFPFQLFRQKKYGDLRLSFYKHAENTK